MRSIKLKLMKSLILFLLTVSFIPANAINIDLFSDKDTSVITEPVLKKLYLPLLPIIGYAPANGSQAHWALLIASMALRKSMLMARKKGKPRCS